MAARISRNLSVSSRAGTHNTRTYLGEIFARTCTSSINRTVADAQRCVRASSASSMTVTTVTRVVGMSHFDVIRRLASASTRAIDEIEPAREPARGRTRAIVAHPELVSARHGRTASVGARDVEEMRDDGDDDD